MNPLKITSLIVDDEANSQENIEIILRKFCPQILISGTASTLSEAEKMIKKHKPQLVFLDIQLGAENAFTLLKRMHPVNFEIIFITAYNDHAVKAFDVMAVDYLLKPIDFEPLVKAVEKAEVRIKNKEIRYSMDEVIQQVKNINRSKHKIGLATAAGYEMVYITNIAYCLANGSYTDFFFTSGEKLTVSKNLKYYENILVDYGFLRSHNTSLVNLAYVRRIDRTDGGGLLMEDGELLPVSKLKRREMEERIKENKRLL